MTKNIILGIGIFVAVVLIVGGAMYYGKTGTLNSENTTSTSSTVNTTSTMPVTPPVARKSGVPTVVTNAKVAESNSSAIVTGMVTPNGAQTTYWFEYGKTNRLEVKTTAKIIGSGFVAIPSPEYITGLSANTQYSFRLSAKNTYGTVNGPTFAFTTNSNPPVQGIVPTVQTVSAMNISRTGVSLQGNVNPNGFDTSYWFEYGETTNLGNLTSFQSAGNGRGNVNVSASLSGLKPVTRYYYRVNAQNQYGTVNGALLSFDTQGPIAPSVTTNPASAITGTSATLNARVNSNGVETTYWFEYGTDSAFGSISGKTTPKQKLDNIGNASVSAEVDTFSVNTQYYYRIVASNAYETVYGNIVNFKTKTIR